MFQLDCYSLLPCTKEDFSAIAKRGHFCYPPYDPTEDDDPMSLDTFFCHALEDGEDDFFFKTYKLVKREHKQDILALASIANSNFVFGSYESKPTELQGSGFNEAIPAVLLVGFGVRNDLQKKGLGSIAFEKLKNLIRCQSISGARILTLHPLESAIPFYLAQKCKAIYSDDEAHEIEHMYIDLKHS